MDISDKWCPSGPVSFNIFINDRKKIKCTPSKFADDTKLSGAVEAPEEQDAIQKGLDKLKKWVYRNVKSFNKTKCWCCTWLGAIPCTAQAGDEQMESSPAQRDLGVLLGERLDMTLPWALPAQRAKRVLGCIQSSVGSRGGRGFCPSALLC
ncbi:hypothetical protein DUI87_23176 [Hirundo rustica rustica]|uniref:Rna-directed dna polymerase from mobile element jockey-like n=1 Tax=Hirundo rustica rustica TaxID=333673 RepID=A0A3M0JPA4_HIRRU|nr:hypothetical protein DUI87_23176 [Hirundo rustica rustica]